jgi:hypothetical protein
VIHGVLVVVCEFEPGVDAQLGCCCCSVICMLLVFCCVDPSTAERFALVGLYGLVGQLVLC